MLTPEVAYPKTADRTRGADVALGAAVIGMGLLAGLIFAFTVAVMPGLTAAHDRTLVDAMQEMADNPVFPLTFLVAPALAVVALVKARELGPEERSAGSSPASRSMRVTAVVTFGIHIPLNDDLVKEGDPAQIQTLAAVHDDFATPWVARNIVRSLASTAAFGVLAWALVLRAGRAKEPGGATR